MIRVTAIALLATLLQVQPAPFVPRMFNAGGQVMPYRLFIPKATQSGKLPLIVWLHGASGVGTDNKAQITEGGNEIGSRLWIRDDIQQKHPAFVVAPQAPADQLWGAIASAKLTTYGQMVIDLVDNLAREFPIDRDRVYLVGQSRGGIGVWDLVTKRPDVFAAAVPVCALGDPTKVAAAREVKVWVFHGLKDTGMPVANARSMVEKLKTAGASVRYTEYKDLSHDIWGRVFAEPGLPDWLFAQRRTAPECEDCGV